MLFSDKYGFTADPRSVLQIECANDSLRMSIYNALYECIGKYDRDSVFEQICYDLWTEHWHHPADGFPDYYFDFFPHLKSHILRGEWYEGYNIIDFILEKVGDYSDSIRAENPGDYSGWTQKPVETTVNYINCVLEREGAGYRIVNVSVTPITNETEIASIEEAVESSNDFVGASAHLDKALQLLSKKPHPDYHNSIKESISAAESAAKKIAPGKNNTLADAINTLQTSKELHKSLAESWKKMFGYTSAADGIRHAGCEEPVELNFAFAKYMLVTCSAFVNYLAEEFGQDE